MLKIRNKLLAQQNLNLKLKTGQLVNELVANLVHYHIKII